MKLSSQTLQRAAELAANIEAQQNELDQLLAGQIEVGATSMVAPRANNIVHTASGRRFTPEAIEKIRMAQKRRWKNARKAAAAAQAAVQAQATQVAAPVAPAPAPAPVAVAPAPAPVVEAPAPVAPVQAAPTPHKSGSKKAHKEAVTAPAPEAVAA